MEAIDRYKIRLSREKKARKEAETLLREKAHELYLSNQELQHSQDALKEENKRRTYDLIRIQSLAKIASWRWELKAGKILWSDEISSILELSSEEKEKKESFWKTIYYLKRCDKISRNIILTFLRNITQQTKEDKSKIDNESFGLEHDMIMPSGQIKKIRMMYECTYNENDNLEIIIGTIQDITTQKNYEKILLENEQDANERVKQLEHLHEQLIKAQVQADLENQRKSEFLSTVNHELRTPLTSIHGALELIRTLNKDPLNIEKSNDLVDIAYRNSERLKILINDILDTEKIESGNIVFNFDDHFLPDILKTCVELNDPYAKQHDVHFHLSKDIPHVHICADLDRFMQVMANLLSNAAKFSHQGDTIDILCSINGNFAQIEIKDYGTGMPDNFKDNIFKKFAQADMSDTRNREGTGLGLYITKSIVEQHNGKITYKSSPNKGTSFFVTIPLINNQ